MIRTKQARMGFQVRFGFAHSGIISPLSSPRSHDPNHSSIHRQSGRIQVPDLPTFPLMINLPNQKSGVFKRQWKNRQPEKSLNVLCSWELLILLMLLLIPKASSLNLLACLNTYIWDSLHLAQLTHSQARSIPPDWFIGIRHPPSPVPGFPMHFSQVNYSISYQSGQMMINQ